LLFLNEFENVESNNGPVREKAVHYIVLVREDVEIRVQAELQRQVHMDTANIHNFKRSTGIAKSCIANRQGAEPMIVQALCFSKIEDDVYRTGPRDGIL
jgi:hypothetical protein